MHARLFRLHAAKHRKLSAGLERLTSTTKEPSCRHVAILRGQQIEVLMKTRILLALAAIVVVSAPLLADKWPAPTPKVFASQFGSHGFKVLKPEFGGISEGVLFRLDAEGREQVVW